MVAEGNLEKEKVVFVVDLSWLYYRSKFAFNNLTWTVDGVTYGTGTVYGIYDALMIIMETFGMDVEIILAMDGQPRRNQAVSGAYKSGRESMDTTGLVELSRWDIAKHFCLLPQVRLAYHKWMEADETMGFIAKMKKPNEKIIIFSGDGDMRQLIDSTENVFCASEYSKSTGYILEDEIHLFNQGIKDLSGLEPGSVALHLAICGDSSDGVPGISRFLRAVSKEIANKARTLDGLKEMVSGVDTMEDGKLKKGLLRIREEMRMVEDNWSMVNIDPMYIPKYYDLRDFEDVNLEWFDKYGCQKIYTDLCALLGVSSNAKEVEGDSVGVAFKGSGGLDNRIFSDGNEFNFEE